MEGGNIIISKKKRDDLVRLSSIPKGRQRRNAKGALLLRRLGDAHPRDRMSIWLENKHLWTKDVNPKKPLPVLLVTPPDVFGMNQQPYSTQIEIDYQRDLIAIRDKALSAHEKEEKFKRRLNMSAAATFNRNFEENKHLTPNATKLAQQILDAKKTSPLYQAAFKNVQLQSAKPATPQQINRPLNRLNTFLNFGAQIQPAKPPMKFNRSSNVPKSSFSFGKIRETSNVGGSKFMFEPPTQNQPTPVPQRRLLQPDSDSDSDDDEELLNYLPKPPPLSARTIPTAPQKGGNVFGQRNVPNAPNFMRVNQTPVMNPNPPLPYLPGRPLPAVPRQQPNYRYLPAGGPPVNPGNVGLGPPPNRPPPPIPVGVAPFRVAAARRAVSPVELAFRQSGYRALSYKDFRLKSGLFSSRPRSVYILFDDGRIAKDTAVFTSQYAPNPAGAPVLLVGVQTAQNDNFPGTVNTRTGRVSIDGAQFFVKSTKRKSKRTKSKSTTTRGKKYCKPSKKKAPRKVHVGKNGGKYIVCKGRKRYVK